MTSILRLFGYDNTQTNAINMEQNWKINSLRSSWIRTVKNHPNCKKLSEAMELAKKEYTSFQNLSSDSKRLLDVFPQIRISSGNQNLENQSVYLQNNQTISEAKEYINENGENLRVIELTYVNDSLIKLISEKCQKLESFAIDYRMETLCESLTNEGLSHISKLTNLNTLILNIPYAVHLTSNGMQNLLSTTYFQDNLKVLFINLYCIGSSIQTIAQYKQLQKLILFEQGLPAKDIETLVSTPTLKSSLQSLELVLYPDQTPSHLTSKALNALSQYNQLTECKINADWKVQEKEIIHFLNSQPKLRVLSISGTALPSSAAPIITKMPLTSLTLSDCSLFSENDFCELFNPPSLESLNFGNPTSLSSGSVMAMSTMQNLSSIAITDFFWPVDGMKTLCDVPTIQEKLRSLYLASSNGSSEGFGEIKKLKSLELLRIACPTLNDLSMKELMTGPVKQSLKTLAFENVSISDAVVEKFSEFEQLTSLALINCFAITVDGLHKILDQSKLRNCLKKYYVAGFQMSEEMIPEFEHLEVIEVLIIGNPYFGFEAADKVFNLKNIKKNNTLAEIFWGHLIPYKEFQSA